MARKPRFYQTEAHDAFMAAIETPGNNPLVGLPCGTGKSLLFAMIASTMAKYPAVRVTCLINSKKLVSQNLAALKDYAPWVDVGVFCDGLGEKDASRQVTIGTIQSAAKHYRLFGKQTLLFIDEAQNVSPNEETQYQDFIAGLRDKNKNLIIGGASATLFRSKGGMLINHGLFTNVCYDITGWRAFEVLVNMGYLVPLTSSPTDFSFDVSDVRSSGEDFNQTDIQEAVSSEQDNIIALKEAMRRGADRNHWIIFAAGIKHVEQVHRILSSWGQSVVMAHSKMKTTDADAAIAAYEQGHAKMIVSDNMLTVGFDAPFTDHIVILRPSKSVVRHVQGLGRGTRAYYAPGYDLDIEEQRHLALQAAGRTNCLVSDFGKNLERLGPINDPKVPGRRMGKGELPIKICTTDKLVPPARGCGEYNFTAARFCCRCGAAFAIEEPTVKIENQATEAVATRLSVKEFVARWVPIKSASYSVFRRGGKQSNSMQVTYFATNGISLYTEFVTMIHKSESVRNRAIEWWAKRGIAEAPVYPENAVELAKTVEVPKWILVQLNLTHPKVIQVSFETEEPELYDHEATQRKIDSSSS